MHVTILALGSLGDVIPFATLGRALVHRNHQVSLVTFEKFASLARQNGLDFLAIQGDPQRLVAKGGAAMFSLVRSFGSLAKSYAIDFSNPKLKETDLLINQLPMALYGWDLAEKYNLPMIMGSVIPLCKTDMMPLAGFSRIRFPGYNRFTYRLAEQLGWQMFRRIINQWRKNVLGLAETPFWGYFEHLGTREYPIINGFSSEVVPRPPDWDDNIHVTGYWFPEDPIWKPSIQLERFLEKGDPPIFIGFGSMPIKNKEKTGRIILDAIEISQQRCIIHSGWSALGIDNLSDHILQVDYVPYDWLFPRMKMIIHHGGSGTTAFALKSGKPSMAVPFVFDQFYWGKRISQLGVGPEFLPFKSLSSLKLAERITQTIQDEHKKEMAHELGIKIGRENGLQKAVDFIEQRYFPK